VIAFAAAAACALAMPAAAWAHAALLRTSPVASRTVNRPPPDVRLTYSEPIEARFAIVSVTNSEGRQVTAGSPRSAAGQPQTLVTPLERVPEGWYLVFWRVISADGHPVRGAFTFAVGPNPGPPPQFRVPSLSETAKKFAEKRSKIANAYIKGSNLDAFQTDAAFSYNDFGMLVYFIEPDLDKKMPRIRVRDSAGVYAEWGPDGRVVRAAEAFCLAPSQVVNEFPGAQRYLEDSHKMESSLVEVVRYALDGDGHE